MNDRFEIATASVVGAAHRAVCRGSQDGHAVLAGDDAVVAIVTDGCGASPNSEVGAALAAQLWARALSVEVEGSPGLDIGMLLRAREQVLLVVGGILDAMPGPRAAAVRDFFLFTVVGAVVGSVQTMVFAIGDGVISINGSTFALESGADNAPAYMGYDLCEETRGLGELSFIAVRPTREVKSLVLATDGAAPLVSPTAGKRLSEVALDSEAFENADHLRRELESLAAERSTIDWEKERVVRHRGPLRDDTTVVAIRAAATEPRVWVAS